jgi:GNAT superfamily N-acetyltransferase
VDSENYRLAMRSDLNALFDCDPLASSGDSTRRVQIAKAVDQSQCSLWLDDDQVVGFTIVTACTFFGRDFLELLVVADSARRRGIGRALLRALSKSSPGEVWTSTNESNLAMRSLLASEGWQFGGTLHGLDGDDPELFFFLKPSASHQ